MIMSYVVQNLGDFIKVLLQTFNFSATFPGLVLIVLIQQFILPAIPHASVLRMNNLTEVFASPVGTLACAALIGYVLDATNLRLIRFFEGYWVPHWGPLGWFRKTKQDFLNKTWSEIHSIGKLASELEQQVCADWKSLEELNAIAKREPKQALQLKPEINKVQESCRERGELVESLFVLQNALLEEVRGKYPRDPDSVLPTSFGNIIAAAEEYPDITMGMDAVALWPFLVPTLTQKGYSQHLMREKSMMDFLINISVVVAIFGLALGFVELRFIGWSLSSVWKMSLVAIASWFFFKLSIQGAASWATMVRTAFILFRADLRQTLGLREVHGHADERLLWETASEFLRTADSKKEQIELGAAIFDPSHSTQTAEAK
jgi:hypothetical protein